MTEPAFIILEQFTSLKAFSIQAITPFNKRSDHLIRPYRVISYSLMPFRRSRVKDHELGQLFEENLQKINITKKSLCYTLVDVSRSSLNSNNLACFCLCMNWQKKKKKCPQCCWSIWSHCWLQAVFWQNSEIFCKSKGLINGYYKTNAIKTFFITYQLQIRMTMTYKRHYHKNSIN